MSIIGAAILAQGVSSGLAFQPALAAQVNPAGTNSSNPPGGNTAGPPAVGQATPTDPAAGRIAGVPPADARVAQTSVPAPAVENYSYNPSGRRDPFASIVTPQGPSGPKNPDLPPLQRVGFTELSLIGIIWGGFGYTAMVQTPDGKGYTVRRGTRIGPNDGVVSEITEGALVLREQFTDVYGKKQVREYVKLLHPKEGSE
ncbi:MAG: pilus assembly protein PilP [Nitrospirae bacterium]|nr:pilus assembly protein PilP [Nitrospirota bacterium]